MSKRGPYCKWLSNNYKIPKQTLCSRNKKIRLRQLENSINQFQDAHESHILMGQVNLECITELTRTDHDSLQDNNQQINQDTTRIDCATSNHHRINQQLELILTEHPNQNDQVDSDDEFSLESIDFSQDESDATRCATLLTVFYAGKLTQSCFSTVVKAMNLLSKTKFPQSFNLIANYIVSEDDIDVFEKYTYKRYNLVITMLIFYLEFCFLH